MLFTGPGDEPCGCVCVCIAEAGGSLISAGRLRCSGATAASSATSLLCHRRADPHPCRTRSVQNPNQDQSLFYCPITVGSTSAGASDGLYKSHFCIEDLHILSQLIRTDLPIPPSTSCAHIIKVISSDLLAGLCKLNGGKSRC